MRETKKKRKREKGVITVDCICMYDVVSLIISGLGKEGQG